MYEPPSPRAALPSTELAELEPWLLERGGASAVACGEHDGVRYRRLRWSPVGIFCVNDQTGEEEIGLFFKRLKSAEATLGDAVRGRDEAL